MPEEPESYLPNLKTNPAAYGDAPAEEPVAEEAPEQVSEAVSPEPAP